MFMYVVGLCADFEERPVADGVRLDPLLAHLLELSLVVCPCVALGSQLWATEKRTYQDTQQPKVHAGEHSVHSHYLLVRA